MSNRLKFALVVGLLAGLVVGGFHNVFTVPVMEEAIALEGQHAQAAGTQEPVVSLGAQRAGMTVGVAIFGVILGAIFGGLYALVARMVPNWRPLLVGLVAAAVGFWSLSLFPALKYPPNPPGVGEAGTLLFRQGFQFLLFVLSLGAAAGALAFPAHMRRRRGATPQPNWAHAYTGLAYMGAMAATYFALPSNPDPVTVPSDLLWRFRVLSVTGHLLLWVLIGIGVPLLPRLWKHKEMVEGGQGRAELTR